MFRLLLFISFLVTPFWSTEWDAKQVEPLVIVNKRINQLAYVENGSIQMVEQVATGKTQELTPEGLFTITVKAKNPYYRRENIPGGDPRNPLGTRWIGFDAKHTNGRIYGVHGTNDPSSIGKYISNGCIRMHKDSVEKLYDKVPIGTKILITNTNESFQQLAKKYASNKR
ncbi:lipoprotein-anchoring transpeptidase ErfK/SrfK [Oikeobacillus pervagus]|uniref:Lipoprotein-anchoring transpeptidase ErfK/SrfK n=1 Tax=Oikeobacillus pervagus TaxID=1325931 RepID=A0AAJ1WHY0_9BACI|nr:L,D-transpeptidase [Oikeobacillus pervagus]MDQ0213798.1 lipoprotein-anchoring transpeptidase ErfK/SrfK [Oikeobacillus pervagus]